MKTFQGMIYSGTTLTFIVDGAPYSVDVTHPAFEDVKSELRKPDPDVDAVIAMIQPTVAIGEAFEAVETSDYLPRGVVSVTRNSVLYNGEPVEGVLVDRILTMIEEGFDMMPMVRFLENLFTNPADFARDELYLWLETSNLPITEDGYFLAYKNVNGDFTSIHDGKTKNDVGTIVKMPRYAVDDNRNRTCSAGLHFCSASYLPHFSNRSDGRTVLLKINPADVVSIPSDYGNAKGRAWQYEVLREVDRSELSGVWPSVVAPDASEIDTEEDEYDAEYEDDYYEDDVAADEAEADRLDALLKEEEDFVAERNRIRDLGIVALRREASQKGFKGAWKGPRGPELRKYLIDQIGR